MARLVLVVDDDLLMQKLVQTRMTQEGYEVICANNGLEGLQVMEKRKPDLIISDVMMPIMNGFIFYKQVKRIPELVNIPFLVITSYPETQDSFLLIGADAFIAKPFDMAQLLAKSKQLISGLRVQSVNLPKDKKVSAMKDSGAVLVTADLNDLHKYLKTELQKRDFTVTAADSGQGILEEAIKINPLIIMINCQIKNTPATEMVKALNEFEGLQSQIVIYSYFINEDLARDSDLHYFYSTNIEQIAKESKLPVKYLGSFSKKATKENLLKALEKCLWK